MKYTSEIVVNLPRDRVIELFDDPDNLKEWQPGLQSFEHVSGEQGQPGAKSRLVFNEGGRRIEMIETISRRDLPEEFSGTYETKGAKNWITNRFFEDGPDRTRWVAANEFQFSGFMRVMAVFMRGAFPRQSLEFMELFKKFAEGMSPSQDLE